MIFVQKDLSFDPKFLIKIFFVLKERKNQSIHISEKSWKGKILQPKSLKRGKKLRKFFFRFFFKENKLFLCLFSPINLFWGRIVESNFFWFFFKKRKIWKQKDKNYFWDLLNETLSFSTFEIKNFSRQNIFQANPQRSLSQTSNSADFYLNTISSK